MSENISFIDNDNDDDSFVLLIVLLDASYIQNILSYLSSRHIFNTLPSFTFISNIDEGIEVLTGVPAGKKDKDGHFPAGTINYLVYEKLKKYAKISENK